MKNQAPSDHEERGDFILTLRIDVAPSIREQAVTILRGQKGVHINESVTEVTILGGTKVSCGTSGRLKHIRTMDGLLYAPSERIFDAENIVKSIKPKIPDFTHHTKGPHC